MIDDDNQRRRSTMTVDDGRAPQIQLRPPPPGPRAKSIGGGFPENPQAQAKGKHIGGVKGFSAQIFPCPPQALLTKNGLEVILGQKCLERAQGKTWTEKGNFRREPPPNRFWEGGLCPEA